VLGAARRRPALRGLEKQGTRRSPAQQQLPPKQARRPGSWELVKPLGFEHVRIGRAQSCCVLWGSPEQATPALLRHCLICRHEWTSTCLSRLPSFRNGMCCFAVVCRMAIFLTALPSNLPLFPGEAGGAANGVRGCPAMT
jgi:hypothetical protein